MCFEKETIFTLTSKSFRNTYANLESWILKQQNLCDLHCWPDESIPDPIQRPQSCVELEVPTNRSTGLSGNTKTTWSQLLT
jgi:hypothetical protein